MRKGILIALLLALCLLTGCAPFAREYVSVHDYVLSPQEPSIADGKITVRNYNALKQALLRMAYAGQTEGNIVFDAAYEGDAAEDMASACWAVRTQDALCAYCVENIAYELNKIVTINEAGIRISYSEVSESPENIRHLAFSSEAERPILEAMERGEGKLALLVGRSGFTADDMAAQVLRTYRENPTVLPREPVASVNIYSGTASQRLYEINIRYGMSAEELELQRERLREIKPFADKDLSELSEADRAYVACRYLIDHCAVAEEAGANSAYAALVEGSADSEGMAFAYVALCRQLGVDCSVVYGQHDWLEHSWNIIRASDACYHVDVTECARNGMESGFLRNDESFWGLYRWDVSSYPKCQGSLRYEDVSAAAKDAALENVLDVSEPDEEADRQENSA